MPKYNGVEYTVRPLTLGLRSILVELLEERNRLVFDAVSKLDLKKEHEYNLKIKRLEGRIAQCEAGGKDPEQPKRELELLREQMLTDTAYLAMEDLKTRQLQLVDMKLICNEDLMKTFLENALEPKCEIDLNEEGAIEFLSQALADFFFRISANRNELKT